MINQNNKWLINKKTIKKVIMNNKNNNWVIKNINYL